MKNINTKHLLLLILLIAITIVIGVGISQAKPLSPQTALPNMSTHPLSAELAARSKQGGLSLRQKQPEPVVGNMGSGLGRALSPSLVTAALVG